MKNKLINALISARAVLEQAGETSFEDLKKKDKATIFNLFSAFDGDSDADSDNEFYSIDISDFTGNRGDHMVFFAPNDEYREFADRVVSFYPDEDDQDDNTIASIDTILSKLQQPAKIFNGTPHPINIVSNGIFNPAMRKIVLPEGEPSAIVRSITSNAVVSAKINKVDAPDIDGIPVQAQSVVGIDDLPEGYDAYIVSAVYAVAARQLGRNTSKLYIIADPVFTTDGQTIIGCRALAPAL